MFSRQSYVIDFIDPATACIDYSIVLKTDENATLSKAINLDDSEITPADVYELESKDLDIIKSLFKLTLKENTNLIPNLRTWRQTDGLPYKIHTNRELVLMIKGSKPLAVFSDYIPSSSVNAIPEAFFEPYVEKGLFIKREYVSQVKQLNVRTVLYAQKSEEWRINAYILLKEISEKVAWNEGFERMEGKLLGYTNEQIEIYISNFYNKSLFSVP